jgi:hypothetical protein
VANQVTGASHTPEARDFYLLHEFELSPSDPPHLILMLKDLPPLSD